MKKAKQKIITLADIAQAASVSINTVSKVLAGQTKIARIKDRTALEIRQIADELGYVPNEIARTLRTRHTGLIGIFVADMTDPVYAGIVHCILQELPKQGYFPILTVAEAGLDLCIKAWTRNRIEGLILCGTIQQMDADFFQTLSDIEIPTIIAGNSYRLQNSAVKKIVSMVHVDNGTGIRMALEHIQSQGKKKIAFISGPQWHSDSFERQLAYKNYIRHFHAPIIVTPTHKDQHWKLGYNGTEFLINQKINFDAIIAYDDLVAFGAMRCLYDNGITIPEKVAIAGFDNLPQAEISIPTLTSIEQPVQEIGAESINMLKTRLSSQLSLQNKLINPILMIRESTKVKSRM